MNKTNNQEIKKYYQLENVVKDYDKKRFSGYGGNHINKTETSSIIKYINSGNILEIAAGTGRLTKQLVKRKGIKVTCLDSSGEMLKLLKKNIGSVNLIEQSAFDRIKISQKFDLITALRFFDHFSIMDQSKILKNIKNSLRKDGKIVFSCLNSQSLESFFSRLFYFSKVNFFYSSIEYKKLFTKHGLEIVSYHSDFFLPRGIYLMFRNNRAMVNIISALDRLLLKLFTNNGALYTFNLKFKK